MSVANGSGTDRDRCLGTLAKQIERRLKEREFYLVLEGELERCWPSQMIERTEREEQIKSFAKSHGWNASVVYSNSGLTRAIFSCDQRKVALH